MMVVLTRTEHLQSVRERIEAAIADLLYLPPYSPDLNRIEKAWCKLKNTLSLIESQNSRSPDQIVAEHLPAITLQNAQARFRHEKHRVSLASVGATSPRFCRTSSSISS
jgi:transposase